MRSGHRHSGRDADLYVDRDTASQLPDAVPSHGGTSLESLASIMIR